MLVRNSNTDVFKHISSNDKHSILYKLVA